MTAQVPFCIIFSKSLNTLIIKTINLDRPQYIMAVFKTGEGKRRNEFAEWNVERRAEWHNYAK